MEHIFLSIVNHSLVAGWLVIAVLILRVILKKANVPKWLICLMWVLVALRLILPYSIESSYSLIPSAKPLPDNFIYTDKPYIDSGISYVDRAADSVLSVIPGKSEVGASANRTQIWSFVCSRIWIAGAVVMLVYAAVSALLLKHRLAMATLLQKGVKQSENIDSPFVLGVFKPVVYLPYAVEACDLPYVLAHEQTHIKRRDYLWKILGFVLLCVYWFNPLMWAAYILFCRDIEAACDERVIKDMEKDDRRAYSTALLNSSVKKKRINACPIAFGENGVKSRVRNVMNYKKPAFWIVIAAAAACVVLVVCFMTNPIGKKDVNGTSAVRWFDCLEGDEYPFAGVRETVLDEYEGVVFRCDSDKLEALYADRTEVLFTGMPIWNVYFCDVTGDGNPDICATISVGSGIIDERILVYDFADGSLYELSDRGKYDYELYIQDDMLYAAKSEYNVDDNQGKVVESKPLSSYTDSFKRTVR